MPIVPAAQSNRRPNQSSSPELVSRASTLIDDPGSCDQVCNERLAKGYFCSMRLQGGLGVLVVVALLGGCSKSTTGTSTSTIGTSTTTRGVGSLNATPCNYAQAWRDNPGQFSEYSTMARYARMASSAELRADGRQLASALMAHDTIGISELAGNVFATCQQLGFVKLPPVAPSTTS
jgi:hypothetical protein